MSLFSVKIVVQYMYKESGSRENIESVSDMILENQNLINQILDFLKSNINRKERFYEKSQFLYEKEL